NMSYISAAPMNLLAVMPLYSHYSVAGGQSYLSESYDFSGCCSSSWYIKRTNDFFYMHIEQLAGYFCNYSHGGEMEWFIIDLRTHLD
ncbi:hypothetical protein NL332_27485, partial [Klebsiella pneumoniae]|nr:hypothetical protein [Klebsiella pneumoniae]